MAPLITVRNVDPQTGEPQYGNGAQNYVSDGAAVALIIGSTLRLLRGEMFLNLKAGIPDWQALLSHSITLPAVALIFQTAILNVPFVTGMSSMTVDYLPAARGLTFSAQVQTAFGGLTVSM